MRALVGAPVFVAVAIAARVAARFVMEHREIGFESYWVPPFWEGMVPRFFAALLLALGLGASRALEPLGARLRPEESYGRKLAAGALVGVGAFLVALGLVLQIAYARGLFQDHSVSGGLEAIASVRALSTRDGIPDFLGLVIPFALVAFARFRGLPVREQVFLVAAAGLLWFAPLLVYEVLVIGPGVRIRAGDALAGTLGLWLSALLVPSLTRLGDRLERRRVG